ncbi:MAG: polysaccharide biosynthesis C-terminal domain-containing protein [Candidatus Lokiarchaeota archaeon]|nr:polysaccharide biosynthesis C-terminal domain-containing protein [Candidatus Lokiarchaeota archaeon]
MSLSRKFSISIVSKIATIVFALLTSVFLSRNLGPEQYGVLRFILLIVTTSYLIGNFGILESVTQSLAKKYLEKGPAIIISIFWSILLFLIIIIVFIIYSLLSKSVPLYNSILIPVFLFILISILNQASFSVLLGLDKINHYNILTLIKNVLYFTFIILIIINNQLTIENIIFCQIIVSLIIVICITYIIKPEIKRQNIQDLWHLDIKKLIKNGILIYISNLSSFLNYRFDMFMLKIFTSFKDIGLYSIAVQMIEKLWIIPESIRNIIYLEIAGKRRNEEFVLIIFRINLLIMLIICTFIIIFAHPLIIFLFSTSYEGSVIPLIILMPGIFFFSFSKILAAYFLGIDEIKVNLKSSIISSVLNIFLNLLLIPKFGIMGAATATTLSYSSGAYYHLYKFKSIANVNTVDLILIKKTDLLLFYQAARKSISKRK